MKHKYFGFFSTEYSKAVVAVLFVCVSNCIYGICFVSDSARKHTHIVLTP